MTDISLAPLVAAVEPYLVSAAATVVTLAVPYLVKLANAHLGLKISADATAKLQAAAATEAGKLVAQATDNLATAQVRSTNKIVLDATDQLVHRLPGLIEASGVTKADVDDLIVGEVGKLQARMTTVSPAPAPAAPAK